ncbi:MAG: alpha/beta hydrolase, partial [Bradyrhizobium sp.]|nr:alpha/beta hydrolase [Bradyrhizobium sp.]
RKHNQWYYSTPEANADMHRAPQGLHAFLRAYYHHKSADWSGNAPCPLQAWNADELAKLPTYYVMELDKTMAETVAQEMPDAAAIAANRWLPDSELAVYTAEYERNGFQGGLQWYRCGTSGLFDAELQTWSDRTIDVPSAFISGLQDWGIYQGPGVFEAMQSRVCTNMILCELIDRAGHWVQQEQPDHVNELLFTFLNKSTA